MFEKILYTCLLLITFTNCGGNSSAAFTMAEPIRINRFDKALFSLVDQNDPALREQLLEKYPEMLDITGKAILNMRSVDLPGFFDRLENYYAEPTLKNLYQEAITYYDNVEDIEKQLGEGFAWLTHNLPGLPVPDVYMHVSGLSQNVLTGENLLSLSIDKYMGADYPLYKDFFYDYQQIKMQRSQVVPDYLMGWLLSEYPFEGKENVLLERMIHQGKIFYLVTQAQPQTDPAQIFGYTPEQWEWNKKHEGQIWKMIIEQKHLYTPDLLNTNKYFEEMPATFVSPDAPGNLGSWIGWQIVSQYMKQTGSSVEDLLKQANAQTILTESKYKPL